MQSSAPLSDAIVAAVAKLIDDSREEIKREPSHSDLEFYIQRAGLSDADPRSKGQTVGKAKRLRSVLSWALGHNISAGEILTADIISAIQGIGGFRPTSSNYVGAEAIENAKGAFRSVGYDLGSDGSLSPLILDSLEGVELTEALEAYVRRAQQGVLDAALVTGTGKDLDMATPKDPEKQRLGELSHRRMERALFELACSVNSLRNREGTGHGRPFLPSVSDSQARTAVESMGTIAGYMLANL